MTTTRTPDTTTTTTNRTGDGRRRRRRGRLAAVAATLASSFMAVAPAAAETNAVERAAVLIEPSVVFIELEWEGYVHDGEGWLNDGYAIGVRSSCSGTIVNPDGWILTAGHCVDPKEVRQHFVQAGVEEWVEKGWNLGDDGSVRIDPERLFTIGMDNWKVEGRDAGEPPSVTATVSLGASVAGLDGGRSFAARVVEYRPLEDGDVALLKVEQTDLPAAPLAEAADVNVGQEVLSVGYPASSDAVTDATYTATFKDGRISSKKTRQDGLLPVYEISAAMSGGMSGGPTVNDEGEIVGVNSYGINGESQQFNFISPVSLARELLTRNGVTNELGDVSEAYRAGIDAYFAGDAATAVEELERVLEVVPSHEEAQRFLALARDDLAEGGATTGTATGSTADDGTGTADATGTAVTGDRGAPAGDRRGDDGGTSLLLPVLVAAVLAGAAALLLVSGRVPQLAGRGRRLGTTTPAAGTPTAGPVATPHTPVTATATAPTTLAGHCDGCGAVVADDRRFCGDCGHRLALR